MKADSVAQEECDVVVPRARIAEYVKAAKKIASAHGIRVEPADIAETEISIQRCSVDRK